MSNYKIIRNGDSSDSLMHYGVRGMRWRFRKNNMEMGTPNRPLIPVKKKVTDSLYNVVRAPKPPSSMPEMGTLHTNSRNSDIAKKAIGNSIVRGAIKYDNASKKVKNFISKFIKGIKSFAKRGYSAGNKAYNSVRKYLSKK